MIDIIKESNEIYIGTINLPYPDNLQATNKNNKLNMPKYRECVIYVYGDEGSNIPHFHLFEKTSPKDPKTSCAIMIDDNRYFYHNSYRGNLNNKQCRILNAWMNQFYPGENVNNWTRIKDAWNNGANANRLVTCAQPSYNHIKPYIE